MYLRNHQLRLNPSAFEKDSPAHRLAVVVRAETDIERAADSARNPGTMVNPLNLLTGTAPRGELTGWYEYLTIPHVLERCAAQLSVPYRTELLTRIMDELKPPNWEVFFWMQAYFEAELVGALAEASAETRLKELGRKLEEHRRSLSSEGGRGKHQKHYAAAQSFVVEEWKKNRNAYANNKSAFARDYVGRVKHEHGVDVTHKTIATKWLKGP